MTIWMDRFNSSVYVVNVVIRVWSCGGEMSADAIQSIKLRAVSSTLGDCANDCTWRPSNLAPECLSVLESLISSLSSCSLWSTFSRSILDESSPAASIFPIIVNEYADKYCHEFEGWLKLQDRKLADCEWLGRKSGKYGAGNWGSKCPGWKMQDRKTQDSKLCRWNEPKNIENKQL